MTGSLRALFLTFGVAAVVTSSAALAQDIVNLGEAPADASRASPGVSQLAAAAQASAGQVDAGTRADTRGRTATPMPNAARDTVAVMIDQAKIIRLPDRTQTVIVGNPMIADITVQKNGVAVVTGKTYGVTNLIALDGTGGMLAESLVSVQAATESVVVVQRGLERESYSCTPNCQPSILLGDANKYFSEIGGQAGQRNTLATQR